jgi:hypothetical protein
MTQRFKLHMHAFWQALEWMANTILFIWVRPRWGGGGQAKASHSASIGLFGQAWDSIGIQDDVRAVRQGVLQCHEVVCICRAAGGCAAPGVVPYHVQGCSVAASDVQTSL